MSWDTKPEDWEPVPSEGHPDDAPTEEELAEARTHEHTPPLKAPGLTPYDITADFQRRYGGSWSDVSRHLWGD